MGFDTIYIVNITLRLFFNSLSFLGSLFIIISYLKFKRLRKFAFKLILYLSVSDLIFSAAGFLITDKASELPHAYCSFQGFALYYSSTSTVVWTSCIAFSLQSIVLGNNRNIEKNENKLVFVGFILPIFLAIIPLFMGYYGPSSFINDPENRWCGIIRKHDSETNEIENTGVILDWVCRFIPILLCFLFNMFMYFRVKRFFDNLDCRTDLKDIIKNKIKYFPIIPIFCWSIEIVLRILEVISMHGYTHIFEHDYIVWVDFLDSIFEKSHGFINAVVYGLTQYVREEWRNFFLNKGANSQENDNISMSTVNDGLDNHKESLKPAGALLA